jgi:hypothetical protein
MHRGPLERTPPSLRSRRVPETGSASGRSDRGTHDVGIERATLLATVREGASNSNCTNSVKSISVLNGGSVICTEGEGEGFELRIAMPTWTMASSGNMSMGLPPSSSLNPTFLMI